MADWKGRFVWYELMTTDVPAACKFYENVVGWNPEKSQMPGMDYWMMKAGGTDVAGVMAQPDSAKQMGAPPAWLGYVAVENVDAAAGQVRSNGGQVYMGPDDIPNVGRFAVVADPHGAVLGLFNSSNSEDEPHDQEGVGQVGWRELHAGDLNADSAFYAKLFGWEKKESMDMGDMGPYELFGVGDTQLGGMMKNPSPAPPHWNYYFNVDNIDRAVERVKAAGGQVLMDPTEVPGGDWVLIGLDPQGAGFALVGHR